MRSRLALAGISVAAAVLLSCASFSVSGSSKRFASAPVLPPIDPAAVQILLDPPETQYLQIGEIRLDLRGMWRESDVQRDPEIQKVIRQEAARLGADTVISVSLVEKTGGHRPGSLVREPRLVDHVGETAIRTRS